MSEIKKILAEFISYDDTKFKGKVIIKYKQPNGFDKAKEWSHQATEEDLSDDAVLKYSSASAGERFTVHQTKDEKGWPIIVDITDAKDAEDAYTPKGGGKKDWKGGNSDGGVGAQVGNALNVAAITLGAGCTLEDIKIRAKGVLDLGDELKVYLKDKTPKKEPGVVAKEEEKLKTRAELLKEKAAKPVNEEQELIDDALQDVEF